MSVGKRVRLLRELDCNPPLALVKHLAITHDGFEICYDNGVWSGFKHLKALIFTAKWQTIDWDAVRKAVPELEEYGLLIRGANSKEECVFVQVSEWSSEDVEKYKGLVEQEPLSSIEVLTMMEYMYMNWKPGGIERSSAAVAGW